MLVAILAFAFTCQAQEDKGKGKLVRTEPNGVEIYEAPGVVRPEDAVITAQPIVRTPAPTFLELSKSELETRLYDVERKLTLAREEEDPERIAVYEDEKQKTLDRIEAVTEGQ